MVATKPLPAALARNAAAKADAAKTTLLSKANDDLALIARKKLEITESFYEIGEALARLRKDPVPKVLGFTSFAALCEERIEMSVTRADHLIAIAARVRREDAIRWGQEKTLALLEIANATATVDTPRELAAAVLTLPGGKRVDIEKASARQLAEIAKSIRAKRGKGSVRGRTTRPEERKLAVALERRLQAEGIVARVRAVATSPGQVSKIRIEVPADALAILRAALRGVEG